MISDNFDDYVDGGSHKDFTISVVGEEITVTNENMRQDSIILEEALCSETNLRFGACEASKLTAQIANVFENFEGKEIDVTVTMDGNTTKYGRFKVKSDKPLADRVHRTITAYDAMHDIINSDVISWYNGLVFPMTIKAFRDSFFNHLGITQKSAALINDTFSIPGGFTVSDSLSGRTVITSICELNGVFGHINRDGLFEYVSLDGASSFECPPYENNSVTFEDYETEPITKVTMRGTATDVGTSVGVDGNEYIIQGNPLIYGTEGKVELTTALTRLLNKIKIVTFRPFELNKTIGNPCVELGDAISIETRYQTIESYVIRRILSGIQALRDKYSAEGSRYYPAEVTSVQSEIIRSQGKMHELEVTVDGLTSRVSSVETDLDENYSTTSEMNSAISQSVDGIRTEVSQTYVTNNTFNTQVENLQDQIDGAIESFTGSVEPTLSNYPASDWTTNKEKDKHIGDLYLVNSSGGTKAGFYYRFEKNGSTYRWVHIPDNEVQKALEDAAEANAKAIAAQNAADGVAEDLAQNYLTTSEVNSAIDQKAAEITLSVSQTYATQNTVANVKNSTIKSDTLHYLATSASSGVTRQTSGWTTTVQAMTQTKQYLWTYHTYTYGDDHTSDTDPIITGRYGQNGTNGITITSTEVKYQKGTSGTTAPTGTWQTTIPTVGQNEYLWTRTVVTYSDSTSTISYSVSRNAVNGTNGHDGTSPTVTGTTIEYQQSASGTTVPTGTWNTTPPTATAGQYMWTRVTVTYSDSKTAVSYSVAKNGTNGTTARRYDLIVSNAAINKAATSATYNPTSITLTAKYQDGTGSPANYSGRFKIETTTDNSTWTAQYTSSANEATKTYTIPTSISGLKAVRCSLYLAGGTTTLLDQQTLPIVTDGTNGGKGDKGDPGTNGSDGKDAYTVVLTNENHTFAGTTTAAIAASTECQIVGYKGATQMATTIGTISGQPTGMTTSISNNGTTSAKFTVTVTNQMTTKNGVLTVPVTIDGKTFSMKFTYSLAVKGDQGNKGDTGTGIVEVIPLRYASNSTTAPALPTANVTRTDTPTGAWTRGIPALTSTYKYMWTCDQIKYDNNTYVWTSAVRDNALTDLTQRMSNAELKITPEAIVSTVEESNTFTTVDDFNNLQIGGRNLLVDSPTDWIAYSLTNASNQNCDLTRNSKGVGVMIDLRSFDNLTVGDKMYVGFDIKFASGTTRGSSSAKETIQGNFNADGTWSGIIFPERDTVVAQQIRDILASGKEGRIASYFIITENMLNNTSYSGKSKFYIRFDYWTGTVYIKNVKIERSDRPTDWSPAPEDSVDYTNNMVNGIQVGGTQMLWDTNAPSLAKVDSSRNRYKEQENQTDYTGEIEVISDPPVNGIKYGYHITQTGTSYSHAPVFYDNDTPLVGTVKAGQEYTVSLYYKWISGSTVKRIYARVHVNQDGSGIDFRLTDDVIQDGKWHQASATFTATQAMETYGFRIYFGRFRNSSGAIVVHEGYFCGWKLEAGNKATSWSEHPDHYGSKSEIEQLSNKITLKVNSSGRLVTAALGVDPSSLTSYVKVKADDIDIISNGNIQLTGKSIGITSTNFTVTSAGAVTCKNLTVTGGDINLGSGKFKVTNAGALTATAATIKGAITTTSLKIDDKANMSIASASMSDISYTWPTNPTSPPAEEEDALLVEALNLTSGYGFKLDGQTEITGGLRIGGNSYLHHTDINGNCYVRGKSYFAGAMGVGGIVYTNEIAKRSGTAMKIDGLRMKAGTKVVTSTGNTSTAVFTNAQLNTLLGISNSTNLNTIVLASNGDGSAQAAHAEGCTYQNGTWYVTHDRAAASGSMRLNYLVFYWG